MVGLHAFDGGTDERHVVAHLVAARLQLTGDVGEGAIRAAGEHRHRVARVDAEAVLDPCSNERPPSEVRGATDDLLEEADLGSERGVESGVHDERGRGRGSRDAALLGREATPRHEGVDDDDVRLELVDELERPRVGTLGRERE